MSAADLPRSLRMMDIMLIDQVFRGRIQANARIADLGCGSGRNIHWFVEQGHQVSATDIDAAALSHLPLAVDSKRAALPQTDLAPQAFDVVIVNAVLHFAPDLESFKAWFAAAAVLLDNGGLLFIRCASQIAWPGESPCDETGRVIQPGCHFSFLPSRQLILDLITEHDLRLLDPIKTSVVDQQRCMSTFILTRDVS